MKPMHLLMAATALAISAPAAATTITFTEISLPNGTSFTNQYAAYGVTGTDMYYYFDTRDTFDNYGVAAGAGSSFLNFSSAVSGLSIDFLLLANNNLTIDALSSTNAVLETYTFSSFTNVNVTHAFAAANIAALNIRNVSGQIGVSTLRFNAGAVPEPTSWAMLILGLAAVGGAMRVRRTKVAYA